MADKKCPRCGLWNTASALRCDCGYDFEKGTVEESYNKLELRRSPISSLRIVLPLLFIINIWVGSSSLTKGLTAGNLALLGLSLLWSVIVYWLTSQVIQKKNWARIALLMLCPPLGLYLFTSKEITLYMLQK